MPALLLLLFAVIAIYYYFTWDFLVHHIYDITLFPFKAIFWFIIAGIVFFLSQLVLWPIILATSRFSRIHLFFSYNMKDYDVAREVANSLKNCGLQISILSIEKIDQDDLIDSIRKLLKSADAIVAIVGDVKESFANSEILTAASLEKPVILIRRHEKQTLPHTSMVGYPIFDLEQLRKYDFRPIKNFVDLIFVHRHDVSKIFGRVWEKVISRNLTIFGLSFVIIMFCNQFPELVLMLLGPDRASELLVRIPIAGAIGGFALMLMVSVVTILSQRRAQSIARQRTGTRGFNFQAIKSVLSNLETDKAILSCLLSAPLSVNKD
jgi:hypothetical protein